MSDEKTITEREAVLRERAAFEQGGVSERSRLPGVWISDWVRERDRLYPLTVRRRPIRVTLSDGTVWELFHGAPVRIGSPVSLPVDVQYWMSTVKASCRTAEDFEAIAKMLRGTTEEVPEGEE